MLALERHPRNRAILRLLYLGGLRISELCALKGRDLQARDAAGALVEQGFWAGQFNALYCQLDGAVGFMKRTSS